MASHFGLRYAFFVTAGMCALALVGLLVLFNEKPGAGDAGARRGPLGNWIHPPPGVDLARFPLVLVLLFVAQFIDRGLSLLVVPLKVEGPCSTYPASPRPRAR